MSEMQFAWEQDVNYVASVSCKVCGKRTDYSDNRKCSDCSKPKPLEAWVAKNIPKKEKASRPPAMLVIALCAVMWICGTVLYCSINNNFDNFGERMYFGTVGSIAAILVERWLLK